MTLPRTLRWAALFLLSTALLLSVAYRVYRAPFWSYNGARLIPSYAFLDGQVVYSLLEEGPKICAVYPPGGLFVYLPAALFRDTNTAVLAGSTLTFLYTFVPVCLLLWRVRLQLSVENFWAGICIVGFGLAALYTESLRFSMINIHADGPGLGLIATGMLFILWKSTSPPPVRVATSALCFALAVWAKQPFLFASLGPILYFWFSDRKRNAGLFAGFYIAAQLSLLLVFSGIFGARELYQNLVLVQGRMAAAGSAMQILQTHLQAARQLVTDGILFILPCFAMFAARWMRTSGSDSQESPDGWLLPFWCAVTLAPISIAGLAKPAGTVNSLSFANYCFLIAAVLILLQGFATQRTESELKTLNLYAPITMTAVVIFALWNMPLAAGLISREPLAMTEQAVLQRYFERHPGVAYTLWAPQAHYLAEKKLYHTGWGFGDLAMAGFALSPEHVKQYVPSNLKYVLFRSDAEGGDTYYLTLDLRRRFFPEFSKKTTLPDLPGFIAFERESPGQQ